MGGIHILERLLTLDTHIVAASIYVNAVCKFVDNIGLTHLCRPARLHSDIFRRAVLDSSASTKGRRRFLVGTGGTEFRQTELLCRG